MSDIGVKTRAICILGMHRSGTSAIARAINLLGVYLGEKEDIIPAVDYNPEGIWERRDFNSLQERLLAAIRRTWATGMPLPEGWQDMEDVKPFKDELMSIIKAKFSGISLWAWKDPRSTIFIDLWKEVLGELGVGLSAVFVVRNPLDVASSLQKRDGFSLDRGFGIWFNYNLTALNAIWTVPTVFVSYDKFLDNWEPELKRIAGGLEIGWPPDATALRDKMNSFLRHDLRHSSSTEEALKKAEMAPPVMELYKVLSRLSGGFPVSETATEETIRRLSSEFRSYASLFRYDIREQQSRFCQLYIDTGSGFNESQSMRKYISGGERQLEFDLSAYPNVRNLRFDPLDDMVALDVENVDLVTEDGHIAHPVIKQHNAVYAHGDTHIFSTRDGQLQFEVQDMERPSKFIMTLRYLAVGLDTYGWILPLKDKELDKVADILSDRERQLVGSERIVKERAEQLAQKDRQLTEKDKQLAEKDRQLSERDRELFEKDLLLAEKNLRVNDLMNSLSWKITRPLRWGAARLTGKKRT